MKQKIKGVIILNNDLTFFTNEPERSLYDRFSKILKRNTEFFDVLVGYFRASGFYLMQDALKDVEKTRILIGINTDRKILDLYKEAQGQIDEINLSNIDAINEYKENLTTEFEKSNDTEEVEDGVNQFIELIKNGKLELRLYTKQPIHAKVYIMRDFEDSPDFGRVITGSSNFSKSGLVNNLEFNVELKNSSDINFALEKFHSKFPNTYGGKVKKGKIIIKGMTLLDAMIDFKGEYIPGKSTMIIEIDDKKMLKFIAALINSKVSAFYINEKYSSSTYNGGVTFNKKMINSLPIPKNYKDIIDKCVEIVDKILDNSIELEEGQVIIDNIIFKEFNLNEKEIEIIKKTLEKHKDM